MTSLQDAIKANRIRHLKKAEALHLNIAKNLGSEEWVQGEVRYHENQAQAKRREIAELEAQ